MYKAAARMLIRRNIRALNSGRFGPALAMFAPDATLTFPGQNSWARQFREPTLGRERHVTHRDRSEIEAFLTRYCDLGIQMVPEDILVNGPPWNMRAALRARVWIDGEDGGEDLYTNRVVVWVRCRWGRITSQEDYEDSERAAALDRRLGTDAGPAPASGGGGRDGASAGASRHRLAIGDQASSDRRWRRRVR